MSGGPGRRWARAASLVVLVGLLLGWPLLEGTWQGWLDELRPPPTSDAWEVDWPESWGGGVVVIIHVPDATGGGDRWLDASGATLREAASPARILIGGLSPPTDALAATQAAGEAAGLAVTSHQEPMGAFIDSIGVHVGGDGGRWWNIWFDGVYGDEAVDRVDVSAGQVLEWRFT